MIRHKLKKFKRLNKLRTRKILLWISIMLVFSLSLGSLARYYASNTNLDFRAGSSINGETVVVNDLETDWNYYESLNYTEIKEDRKIPTYENKYNSKTLVAVQLNYYAEDINDSSKVGYVSNSELQNKYTYYKYYPIIKDENGKEYINIELIDNPWSKRPTGYGFNNWVCDNNSTEMNVDCNNLEFYYDNQYYTRYLRVPASSSVEDEKLIIDLKTSWIKADIKNNIGELNNYNKKGLVAVSNNSDIVSDLSNNGYNLSGYYYKTSSVDNSNGLYYDINGNVCSSTNICTEGYKLIQSNDTTFNTGSSSLSVSNYYYLVTRDTNIFELSDSTNGISMDSFDLEAPVTITSSHDGSNSYSLVETVFNTKGDMVLENVVMSGGAGFTDVAGHQIYAGASTPYKTLFANFNFKAGRNILSDNNTYSFNDIVGGYNVKVIVESGNYNDLVMLPNSQRYTDISNYGIYGSDYDRVNNDNGKLRIRYQLTSSTGATQDNDIKPVSNMIVKSGIYGDGALSAGNVTSYTYQYGIYAGTIRGDSNLGTHALRLLKVEGGKIVNISGGLNVLEGFKDLSVGIYITGGEIENAVSGAGTALSYGARLISVSGGQVNNAVAAGSNSFDLETTSGPLNADTLAYIGGNAQIGGPSMLNVISTLYDVQERGSVFGAGLGKSGQEDLGIVNNSTVIINGGTIEGDVYGGGNYGGAGLNIRNAKTDLIINDGTIKGRIFGGSNNNGFGNPSSNGTINVTLNNGTVGYIYGGSNVKGLVTGDVTVKLNGGHVTGAVYGGGYGEGTLTNGFINVETKNDNNLVIGEDADGGSIYGGSANGSVNETFVDPDGIDPSNVQLYYRGSTRITSTQKHSRFPNITDESGTIIDIYQKIGGYVERMDASGKVTSYISYSANRACASPSCYLYYKLPFGLTYATGLDPDATYYYAVTNSSGTVTEMRVAKIVTAVDRGNVNVKINGGKINGGVFGGGYGNIAAPKTKGTITVDVYDGDINEVYGGNNVRGDITKTQDEFKLNIYGGKINNVFGGSKGELASTDITNVNVSGGEITGGVYGGGYAAKTNSSYIKVTGGTFYDTSKYDEILNNPDPNGVLDINEGGSIYGGGYAAEVNTAKIEILGGDIFNVFGGSNLSGIVKETYVDYKNGKVINAYGGGNVATVEKTTMNLDGTNIVNSYLGGAMASVTNPDSLMILKNGVIKNIFGGSNKSGQVEYSNVELRNGTVTNVFGGNNEGGTAGVNGFLDIYPFYTEEIENESGVKETKEITGNLTITNVYGGSRGSGAISPHSNVSIKGLITTDADGNEINHLKITNVYGGGYEAKTTDYTKIYIQDVTLEDIFAGGFRGQVEGDTYVNIIRNVNAKNVYGGGYYAHVGKALANSANGEYVAGTGEADGHTYVNIISANISGNVYGSGNASFTYGVTNVNIGDNAITAIGNQINDTKALDYEKSFEEVYTDISLPNSNERKINIGGNVFGGSETNATETTIFDDRFKGVIGASRVNVSGENYAKIATRSVDKDSINLVIAKSIYGGGNNSGVDGTSRVLINKLGTKVTPANMTSIQRATNAYVVDSYLQLSGMKDRAFTTGTSYSLIRIDNMYLLGNKVNGSDSGSTLYLQRGTTFLSNHYSGIAEIDIAATGIKDGSFEEEKVTQGMNGEYSNIETLNVNNAIYVRETAVGTIPYAVVTGEVPSVENDTSNAGSVHGMTFFGLYFNPSGDDVDSGFYNRSIIGGTNVGGKVAIHDYYSYVFGKHDADVETQKVTNGFFTNIYDADTGIVSVDYITPTPDNAAYYRWNIGNNVVSLNVNIEANKYSQRTAVNANLSLEEIMEQLDDGTVGYWSNAKLKILDVETNNLQAFGDNHRKADLVNRTDIPVVNPNGESAANRQFALAMGTTSTGWMANYRTEFYSSDSGLKDNSDACIGNGLCAGDNEYTFDSSHDLRNLSFWLYYSQNLDLTEAVADGDDPDALPSVDMGYIRIKTEIEQYNDDLTSTGGLPLTVYINVLVSLTDGETDSYGALMTPGKKYEIFQDRNVSIAANGSFSLYQKLSLDLSQPMAGMSGPDSSWSVGKLYNSEEITQTVRVNGIDTTQYWGVPYRYLETDYKFPVGSRITMIDLADNKQYFYEVNGSEEQGSDSRYKIYLRDFAKMGYTKLYDGEGNKIADRFFDDDMSGENSKYYHNHSINYAIEEFVFIVDFGGVDLDLLSNMKESETHYLYMKLARMVSSEPNAAETGFESSVIIPRGQPTNDLTFTLNPSISSLVNTTGQFYDEDSGTLKDTTKVYRNTNKLYLRLDTNLNQQLNTDTSGGAIGIVDTQYEDYRVGAKIVIKRPSKDPVTGAEILDENGKIKYELVTDELSGLTINSRGRNYYPYTDGSIRIKLADRITDVASIINFDLSKADRLDYGKYRLEIETFVTFDGLYSAVYQPNTISLDFELLDNEYGLLVSTDSVSINHDVSTGQDENGNNEIKFSIKTKNGLLSPNLKVKLQRRLYEDGTDKNAYSTEYEDINISDIFSEIKLVDSEGNIKNEDVFNSCLLEPVIRKVDTGEIDPDTNEPKKEYQTFYECLNTYSLGPISASKRVTETGEADDSNMLEYSLYATFKNGPTEEEKANQAQAKWKSGTYRLMIYLYDDKADGEGIIRSNKIGETYEYIIIRNLDVEKDNKSTEEGSGS